MCPQPVRCSRWMLRLVAPRGQHGGRKRDVPQIHVAHVGESVRGALRDPCAHDLPLVRKPPDCVFHIGLMIVEW